MYFRVYSTSVQLPIHAKHFKAVYVNDGDDSAALFLRKFHLNILIDFPHHITKESLIDCL